MSLTACSDEPSSSDIEKAVRANVDQSNQDVRNLGGKMITEDMLSKLHEVKKVACAASEGSAGFNCDVELDATVPFIGRSKKTAQIRFVKGSDGWQVTQ
jgi:hypothetical protein